MGRVQELEQAIDEMGGRSKYQRASQVSTSYFSTSKWVLGHLARNGWLYGRKLLLPSSNHQHPQQEKEVLQVRRRRRTKILEVGAINTELLSAASKTLFIAETGVEDCKYQIDVRAIDLHASHPEIQEADFLTMSVARNLDDRYDVIVCSMVLNCVTTPVKRGEMMSRLYHFLRPGGLTFLTLPKSCLTLSPFIDRSSFQSALIRVGFEIAETKDSPKISFFICRRPSEKLTEPLQATTRKTHWTPTTPVRNDKKTQNSFTVELSEESLQGATLTYTD